MTKTDPKTHTSTQVTVLHEVWVEQPHGWQLYLQWVQLMTVAVSPHPTLTTQSIEVTKTPATFPAAREGLSRENASLSSHADSTNPKVSATPRYGYRFRWRRPDGKWDSGAGLPHAPSLGVLLQLLQQAAQAGWL